MIERIIQIISAKADSPRQFALAIGFNYSTLNNYINGRRTSLDPSLLEKISSSFDDIDARWLLTGIGNMILPKQTVSANIVAESGVEYNVSSPFIEQISNLTATVLSQQKTIEKLIAENKKTAALLADNATNADAHGA